MGRKGQSAMEFLMTYGWAILIMLVVIAILFMLGVFNPAGAVPESCVLPAGFSCYSYSIDSTGKLYLDMGQAKGRRVTIRAFTCSAEEVPEPQTITAINIDNGRHKVIANGVQCVDENGDPYTVGDSFRGKIVFTYSEFGSDLTRTASGDISGKMEGTTEGGGGGTPTPTATATPTPTATATPTPQMYYVHMFVYGYTPQFAGEEPPHLTLENAGDRSIILAGSPVEGATVTFHSYVGGNEYSDSTSPLGEAAVGVPAGNYTIKVTKSGYDTSMTDWWVEITEDYDNWGNWYITTLNGGGDYSNGHLCSSVYDCTSYGCYESWNDGGGPYCASFAMWQENCYWCDVCESEGYCPGGMTCDMETNFCIPGTPDYSRG